MLEVVGVREFFLGERSGVLRRGKHRVVQHHESLGVLGVSQVVESFEEGLHERGFIENDIGFDHGEDLVGDLCAQETPHVAFVFEVFLIGLGKEETAVDVENTFQGEDVPGEFKSVTGLFVDAVDFVVQGVGDVFDQILVSTSSISSPRL